MNEACDQSLEQRVLVLAPNDKDAALTGRFLAEARLPCFLCPDLNSLCEELERGAGAAILTEQALAAGQLQCLLTVLARQPPWSEFPLVVLTTGGADSLIGVQALSSGT